MACAISLRKNMFKVLKGCPKKYAILPLIIGQLFYATTSVGMSVSSPIMTVTSDEFDPGNGALYQPDSPMMTYHVNGESRWIIAMWNKTRGGIEHMEAIGTVDKQFAKQIGVKSQNKLFQYDKNRISGSFWIVNIYQSDAGILAFIHVENAEGTRNKPVKGDISGTATGRTRVALAWSSNGGKTFDFLGHILSPSGDAEPSNIQGLPYIIKSGYFYVYFHDTTGLTVARAMVSDVIDAAKKGTVGNWMKYNGPELGFNSSGLGGSSVRLKIDGISHSDAACSTYNGKCYLVLTRKNWLGEDTWVKLFETIDGVNWTLTSTIVEETASAVKEGYQYATIVDASGRDNGVVGQKFFIYTLKDNRGASRAAYRWEVDLGN